MFIVYVLLMNLSWKTAILTWASSWLGKSIAWKLIAQGVTVIALARTEEKLQQVQNEFWAEHYHYFVADISDKASIKNVAIQILATYDTIDLLINNAGIWHQGSTEEHSLDVLEQLLATNVFGVMGMINAFYPAIKKQKHGCIFTVNSLAGVEGNKDRSAYCGTKHALTGYMKYFREEAAADGIKVMQIHPWGMNTSLFETFKSGFGEQERMMDKEKVADIVLFMISQPADMNIDTLVVRKFFEQ